MPLRLIYHKAVGPNLFCPVNNQDVAVINPHYRGAAFVKRLQRDKDCVRIISDNSKYKEMFEAGESQDFRVIGKIRYVMHKVQG